MPHLRTARPPARPRAEAAWRAVHVGVGLVWGLVTSFSAALTSDHDSAMVYLGLGLVVALAATLLAGRAAALISGSFETALGLLVTVHVLAAVTSGVVNGSGGGAILRYVLLLPALAVMIAAARGGGHARDLRLGLTAAGVAFVGYHVAELRTGVLLDPTYRIQMFLNTNSVGFIAAMTGVSMLTLFTRRTPLRAAAAWGIVGACCLVCLATKSRTALLAGMSGVIVVLYRRARESRRLRGLAAGGVVAIAILLLSTRIGTSVAAAFSELYMLDDEYRSVQTGTSRYMAWRHVVQEQWLPNFFLGVGPGRHGPALEAAVNVTSAHNGLLANLAEVGVVGTVPLLLAIGLALARARRSPEAGWALPLVVSAVVESGAETMLFGMGSSGSLLFLLALAALSVGPAPRAVATARWRRRSPTPPRDVATSPGGATSPLARAAAASRLRRRSWPAAPPHPGG